jgi:NTP pyrophosphatase (non-canonical NTP hydrolase)
MTAKGLAKLTEELGELQQVVGKKLAYFSNDNNLHPDGKGDLNKRLEEEMGDVWGAISFVIEKLGLNVSAITDRSCDKWNLFREWDAVPDNNAYGVDA